MSTLPVLWSCSLLVFSKFGVGLATSRALECTRRELRRRRERAERAERAAADAEQAADVERAAKRVAEFQAWKWEELVETDSEEHRRVVEEKDAELERVFSGMKV